MVQLDTRPTGLEPPAAPPRPPGAPPATGKGGGREAAVALVATLALVLGVFGLGGALDDGDTAAVPPAADDAATGAGGGPGAVEGEPVDDRGLALLENGHQHDAAPDVPLDPETQAELDRQLALTQQVVERLPTVAHAEAAGYRRAGPFTPGLGAHYVRFAVGVPLGPNGEMTDEAILDPGTIIYDGTDPDSPIAGFMYLSPGGEPEGFAGPNDHWHYHTNVCVIFGAEGIDAPLGADKEVTAEQCAAVGGNLMEYTTHMLHVWTVPGYESDRGVFSDINPAIACPDGTYYVIPDEQMVQYRLNACRNMPA